MFWKKKAVKEVGDSMDELWKKFEGMVGQKTREYLVEQESWKREKDKLLAEKQKLAIDLAECKKQIQEQTEADLFFQSAKIQKELLAGKTKEEIKPMVDTYEQMRQSYYQQAEAARVAQTYSPYWER